MKIKVTHKEQAFKPVTFELTFESELDLCSFRQALLNPEYMSDNCCELGHEIAKYMDSNYIKYTPK